MNNTKDHRGVINVLSLLLALFLIKEYYTLFDQRNVKNIYRLLHVHNPLFTCVIFVLIGTRSILLYARTNLPCLIVSEIIIYYLIYTQTHGIVSCNTTLLSMINFMKLYSFIFETTNCGKTVEHVMENGSSSATRSVDHSRNVQRTEEKQDDVPPEIELTYFIRFLFLPTLCFSDAARRRKRSVPALFHNLLMACIFFLLANFLVAFYIVPLLEQHTVFDFLTDISVFVRVSATSFIFWIAMFLFFFKYYLSFLAECTNYENKIFGEWWNAQYFRDFWRLWNIPTHDWLRRYVFAPFYLLFKSKWLSSLVVFIISGVLHEIVYILTFKKIGVVVFMSILSQFLFIYLEHALFGPGNLLFWFLFCFIGQPIFLLSLRKKILSVVSIKV
ncbi:hypothetical protein VCUG_00384 [Vavraia culicis subsp. floridensis]|uniref:diacylglycerol O-acyltransferase n=1 Tax=Vavraia culicis (isolate floridensis) TaxID=948595 RepID=L2GWU4_VAVCU|nr:uncharacterized protein VCUG_00384 [Vavraia culicis subsp. floridensis]ELA48146.1 hypothetical protein VCUG_00384 [Vavraia culicis subsp. floridensis]